VIPECPTPPVPVVSTAYITQNYFAAVMRIQVGWFDVSTFVGDALQDIEAFTFIACW
jgi:hypothetical protein